MTCEVMDPGWLREAERLCHQHGTLLIADEVQTGLCRLGPWFAAHNYGVKPDLMTVSKTLSGGYMPISALLVSDEVYQKIFTDFKAGPIYFSTFAENNLAMAAGLATLDVLEEIDAPHRSLEISRQLREGLVRLADRYDCIDRIAGAGLMVGVYFKDAANSRRLRLQQQLVGAFDPGTFAAAVNVDMALRQKVIVQIPGPEINAIKVLPPVVLTDADVQRFLGAFEDTLAYFYQTGPLFSLGQAALQDTARNVKARLGLDDGTPKGSLTAGEPEGAKKKRPAVRSPADTSGSGSGETTPAPSSSTPTS
jgi:ornithine--oxo-acid transaminase